MEPVFDSRGNTVGWIKNEVLYDIVSNPRARIINGNVYSYNGNHLGRFYNGYFRDGYGNAVAFVRGAEGGPLLPITSIPPIPNIPSIPPIPAMPSIPSIPAIPSLSWSNINYNEFLNI